MTWLSPVMVKRSCTLSKCRSAIVLFAYASVSVCGGSVSAEDGAKLSWRPRAGFRGKNISRLENGHIEPALTSVEALAGGFRITIAQLLKGL